MKSPFRLDNRMALITGGSSGELPVIVCEVADLAVYLASDESGFMNSAAPPIDGGWTAA